MCGIVFVIVVRVEPERRLAEPLETDTGRSVVPRTVLERLGRGNADRGEQIPERLISETRDRYMHMSACKSVQSARCQFGTGEQPLYGLVSQSAAAETGFTYRSRASTRMRNSVTLTIAICSMPCRGAYRP